MQACSTVSHAEYEQGDNRHEKRRKDRDEEETRHGEAWGRNQTSV